MGGQGRQPLVGREVVEVRQRLGLRSFSAVLFDDLGYPKTMADWWFGTFFVFPYIGNNYPN